MMSVREIPPIHPGEILLEEYLKPMNISQYRLAKDIHVDPRQINEIIHGQRSITADTALRLARYFGTSERFWLNLQSHYDLELQKMELGDRLEKEVKALA
jgi:addiction module HigA family antidote